MGRSRITYMKGKEWWLLKQRKDGSQVYPARILVGDLGRERVYVPESDASDDAETAEYLAAMWGNPELDARHVRSRACLCIRSLLKKFGYERTAAAILKQEEKLSRKLVARDNLDNTV